MKEHNLQLEIATQFCALAGAAQYIYAFTSLPKDTLPALLHFAHLANEEPENSLLTIINLLDMLRKCRN